MGARVEGLGGAVGAVGVSSVGAAANRLTGRVHPGTSGGAWAGGQPGG